MLEPEFDAPARRFHETIAYGRAFNDWCAFRSRCAIAGSDNAIAKCHASVQRRRLGFLKWQQAALRPRFGAMAQRRHVQLAYCAAELLLLRLRWLRQAQGIAHRRWKLRAAALGRLRRGMRALSTRVRRAAIDGAMDQWKHDHVLRTTLKARAVDAARSRKRLVRMASIDALSRGWHALRFSAVRSPLSDACQSHSPHPHLCHMWRRREAHALLFTPLARLKLRLCG